MALNHIVIDATVEFEHKYGVRLVHKISLEDGYVSFASGKFRLIRIKSGNLVLLERGIAPDHWQQIADRCISVQLVQQRLTALLLEELKKSYYKTIRIVEHYCPDYRSEKYCRKFSLFSTENGLDDIAKKLAINNYANSEKQFRGEFYKVFNQVFVIADIQRTVKMSNRRNERSLVRLIECTVWTAVVPEAERWLLPVWNKLLVNELILYEDVQSAKALAGILKAVLKQYGMTLGAFKCLANVGYKVVRELMTLSVSGFVLLLNACVRVKEVPCALFVRLCHQHGCLRELLEMYTGQKVHYTSNNIDNLLKTLLNKLTSTRWEKKKKLIINEFIHLIECFIDEVPSIDKHVRKNRYQWLIKHYRKTIGIEMQKNV